MAEQNYEKIKNKAKMYRSELRSVQADSNVREELLVKAGDSLEQYKESAEQKEAALKKATGELHTTKRELTRT